MLCLFALNFNFFASSTNRYACMLQQNFVCRMCDGTTKSEMVSFPVHRIRFCARGQLDSAERECFALSFTQKNATPTDGALHQCHVFRCQVPEAVSYSYVVFLVSSLCLLLAKIFGRLFGHQLLYLLSLMHLHLEKQGY